MNGKRFHDEKLDEASLKRLVDLARLARGDILKMTTLAGSGHPGGSMSSIDFYLILYSYANVHPQSSSDPKLKRDFHVFVAMGCGEQQKGQITEARRFAIKYGLDNLTVIIDYNRRQISGVTQEIMPQNIVKNFESDGWRVIEVDDHQFQEVYRGLREAILTNGGMVYRAVQAWQKLQEKGVEVQVLNISCLSDLDIEAILRAAKTGMVITYEDHHIQTGLGSLIANVLAEHSLSIRFRKMGVTQYGSSGKLDDLYRMQGLDVDSLVRAVLELTN